MKTRLAWIAIEDKPPIAIASIFIWNHAQKTTIPYLYKVFEACRSRVAFARQVDRGENRSVEQR